MGERNRPLLRGRARLQCAGGPQDAAPDRGPCAGTGGRGGGAPGLHAAAAGAGRTAGTPPGARPRDLSPPPCAPLTVRTAIAYSCNCFVAHYASRFRAGELAFEMERWGLVSRTNWFGEGEAAGRVWNAPAELQSLGEDGVVVTPASLALAYCRLASRGAPAVLAGMADAVEFGTAQRARVTGLKVAGKTGSV